MPTRWPFLTQDQPSVSHGTSGDPPQLLSSVRTLGDLHANRCCGTGFSGNGCNTVHEHPRNKYDGELKALADKGGVVGIYLMPYLGGAPNQPSKELVMEHIDHAIKVCGEDHVGLGTDGGIEKVELTPEQQKAFKEDVAHRKAAGVSAPEEDRYPYVPDFNGPRKFELIATELQKRGYKSATIEKVLGGNWYRVFGEVWI
jgi:membrane dipeptidase